LKIFLLFTLLFFYFKSDISFAINQKIDYKKLIQDSTNDVMKNSKDAKPIDLESLGLDNIEKKPAKPLDQQSLDLRNIEKPPVDNNLSKTPTLVKSEDGTPKNKEKIENNLKKNQTKILKKNLVSPSEVRKKLEIEESKKIENELEKNKKIRYDNIRNFYLKDLTDSDSDSDEDLSDKDIVKPHQKSLAPFQVDELPPLPILSRSRSSDNYHIPYVYTPKEYIDIMFSAISLGSVSYFNEAFKYVLNPNITNDQGDTILTYSLYLKKYSIMASALAKGADPNLPNQLGHLPVSIAIELNDFIALEMLAKANADLKYRDIYGRTHLMHASRLGFLPAVDLLTKANVNINEMDNDGFTALSIAYRYKRELVVQYLLKNGAKTWIEKPYNPQFKSFIRDLNDRWK